jgi:hypothetical protein
MIFSYKNLSKIVFRCPALFLSTVCVGACAKNKCQNGSAMYGEG